MAFASPHLSSAILSEHLPPSVPGASSFRLCVVMRLHPLWKLQTRPARSTSCCAKKRDASFTDQILDYIEGGPKLRKWYGATELLTKDGEPDAGEEEDEEETDEVRDAVLVTDGESEIGQMVILSLIVKRARVKALIKDKKAAVEAFGNYVEVGHIPFPVVRDVNSNSFRKAFRGVRAVICPSNEGFLSDVRQLKGVEHVVLLSQLSAYKGSSGLQAFMNNKAKKLAEKDEEAVVLSGIPYTIIKAALLQNNPGGIQGFSFKEGVAATGRLSKEDAARICVEALDVIPQKGLVFEVANGEEQISNWKEWFTSLIKKQEQSQ